MTTSRRPGGRPAICQACTSRPGSSWRGSSHPVDFARGNRLLCWYLGGLNFQVVHHLFPKVCHLHYPALSRIIEATCHEHGVRYRAQAGVGTALGSHVRWLKRMGRPEVLAVA